MSFISAVWPEGILAVVGALIVAISAFFSTTLTATDLRQIKRLAIYTLLGAVISSGAGLWAAYGQSISNATADKQRDRIEELNARIYLQTDEITRLGEITYKSLTGHGGYIRLDGLLPIYPCYAGGVFRIESKYPLYDLRAEVVDLNEMDYGDFQASRQSVAIGNIGIGVNFHEHDGKLIKTCNRDTTRLNVFYSARNGSIVQEYRVDMRKLPTGIASRVFLNGQLVFEEVNDAYPRLSNGQPDWELE